MGRAVVLCCALAWTLGALAFLRADGSVHMPLKRTSAPPQDEHNLVLHRWGPTLRASSYHRESYSHHHPIFLVDGRARPGLVEKWASALPDRAPWIELVWRELCQLSRVVIRHGGWKEDAHLTARRYRLSCLVSGSAPGPSLEVNDNEDAVAVHALACANARGLRVDFRPQPAEQVRIYEIEAWGR